VAPDNPKAAGNDLAVARRLPCPLHITFAEVRLIAQHAAQPWTERRVLRLAPT